MNLSLAVIALSLALAGATAGKAQTPPPPGPPPLGVKVLLASNPHLEATERAHHDAFLQTLSANSSPGGGWFAFVPAGLDVADFEHCTISAQDPRTCASRLLVEKQATGATVVVLAFGQGAHARWICVGTGERMTNPQRQIIQFDMTAGLDPQSPRRMETRAAAAGCVTGAGAESGW